MMNYNPLYGWDDGTTERIIEWGNERNGIPYSLLAYQSAN